MNITIDRRANLEISSQISNQIRRSILNRELYLNRPLIEPIQLAKKLGIEESTVLKSYHRLVDEQLLIKDKKGHFMVRFIDAPKNIISQYITVYEGIRQMGLQPSLTTVKQETVLAKDVPALKGEDPQALFHHFQRIYFGDLKPVAFVESYFPSNEFPSLDQWDFDEKPFYEIFAKHYDFKPHHNVRSFYATLLNDEIARHLMVEKGSPGFTIDLNVYNDANRIVEFSIAYLVESLQMEWLLSNPSLDHFY